MTYDFYRKENEVKHFQTEVELRSFIIRFQNICTTAYIRLVLYTPSRSICDTTLYEEKRK